MKARNVLSFGYITQHTLSHQFNFSHKIQNQWLLSLQANADQNRSESENFSSKIFCPESRTGAGGAPGDRLCLYFF